MLDTPDPVTISRADALRQGLQTYFTGKPCKRGHLSQRRAECATCLACRELTYSAWRSANRDHVLNYDRARYTGARRERQIKVAVDWIQANREKYRENAKASYRRNQRRRLAAVAALGRRRRAAVPKWADLKAIARIYEACPPGHHVDHIIPLQGKTVCGLHCESNLQIITAAENLLKGNRFNPEL